MNPHGFNRKGIRRSLRWGGQYSFAVSPPPESVPTPISRALLNIDHTRPVTWALWCSCSFDPNTWAGITTDVLVTAVVWAGVGQAKIQMQKSAVVTPPFTSFNPPYVLITFDSVPAESLTVQMSVAWTVPLTPAPLYSGELSAMAAPYFMLPEEHE